MLGNPKIIALTGVHGTGKTTKVNALAAKFRRDPDCKVGVITEIARLCPMPVYSLGCHYPSIEAQMWIFGAQLQAEAAAYDKYDIIISDRTLIDCIAYTRYFGYHDLARAMEIFAKSLIYRYADIIFHFIADHDYLVDDGFRSMDPDARKKIEKILHLTYLRLNLKIQRQYI